MTRKQKILQMIERLPDDVTYERVIYHLEVMEKIDRGLEQAERGEGIDHEALEAKLRAAGWLESEPSGQPKRKGTSKTSATTSPGTPRARRGHSQAESSLPSDD